MADLPKDSSQVSLADLRPRDARELALLERCVDEVEQGMDEEEAERLYAKKVRELRARRRTLMDER